MFDAHLQCGFCELEYPDFDYLAEHVKAKHREYRCPFCGEPIQEFSELARHIKRLHAKTWLALAKQAQKEGITNMARQKAQPDDPFQEDEWGHDEEVPQASDEVPQASTEERPDFLKPHHLGDARQGTMELVKFTSDTSEYSDVILLVRFRNRLFRLGMRLFSKEYKALSKRFGPKRSDWHGELRYKIMSHKGNPNGYVAVR